MKQSKRWLPLPKHSDVMNLREDEIFRLVKLISEKSESFTNPKIILIGGYALRAYTPYSRYTRDCDFVIRKQDGWHIDKIKEWLLKEINVEIFEKKDTYGFTRFINPFKIGKKSAKIALDFMEGEVRGRTDKAVILLDEKFVKDSREIEILIGANKITVFVPSYEDYLILKTVSARQSDIRDITLLIWKKGVPSTLRKRVPEILPYPEIFTENIRDVIIPMISNPRFLDSWRGTFITKDFDEEGKDQVLERLNELLQIL